MSRSAPQRSIAWLVNSDPWYIQNGAYFAKVQLDFSRPGRPSDNGFCESFYNRVRQELLNPNWFYSIDQVRVEANAWRVDYNAFHPHNSLGNLTPEEFARLARNTNREAVVSRDAVARFSGTRPTHSSPPASDTS